MRATEVAPPFCTRCDAHAEIHMRASAAHAQEDGSIGPVFRELVCAVCFCGTWVIALPNGKWSEPWRA